MAKLIYGVGVNDADYAVTKWDCSAGKRKRIWVCPYFKKWKCMIERCYSEKAVKLRPSYAGCEVCSEWRVFSKFKSWMQQQDWQGKELDKDLLVKGNKAYSPEFCLFLKSTINSFLLDGDFGKDKRTGFSIVKSGLYGSFCRNPFTKKTEYLGAYKTEDEAVASWRKKKHELACQLADLQTDDRAAKALRERYL